MTSRRRILRVNTIFKLLNGMKRIVYLNILSVAALFLASCAKELPESSSRKGGVEFVATLETSGNLKTSLDGLSVNWSSTDAIAVFTPDGTKSCFTIDPASIDTQKHSARFTGDIKSSDVYYAVYPYSDEASFDGVSFTLTAPAVQEAVSGGFGQQSNIAVAVASEGGFAFKNVCTLLKMTVKTSNASKIVFEADGVSLSGTFKVDPDGTGLVVTSGSPSVSAVGNEGNLATGVYYVPVPYSASAIGNLTMTLKSSDDMELFTKTVASSAALRRNWICNTGELGGNGIASASDLVAFRTAVNSGKSTEAWQQDGEVVLLNDIDCSQLDTWTPIGTVTAWVESNTNPKTLTGTFFKGIFNGQGYAVKNLKLASSNLQGAYGFFGCLDGATVKNLVLGVKGDASSATYSAKGQVAIGNLAGVCRSSTVTDCVNNIPVSFTGQSVDDKKAAVSALLGYVCTNTEANTIRGLVNNADATVQTGSNTKNGATCVMFGGIASYVTAAIPSTPINTFTDCVNNGNFTANCGRVSGIIPSLNNNGTIDHCDNYGNITNSFTNSRNGNIVCFMSRKTAIKNSKNAGNLYVTGSTATAAGICALINDQDEVTTSYIENCRNEGEIVYPVPATSYKQLVYTVNNIHHIKSLVAAGKVGKYESDGSISWVALNTENFRQYSIEEKSGVTDITCEGYPEPTQTGISTAEELVEFATLVNEGKDYSKFMRSGEVTLLNDIDCSSISSWTPIGYATVNMPANGGDVISVASGHAFAGTFDGGGYKLKGLKMVAPADGVAGKPYGLFGTLAVGSVVRNFQLDENCSLTVNSTATNACGIVAGVSLAASVRDVSSYAKVYFNPNAGAAIYGGLVGLMNATSTKAGLIDSCHSYGDVTTKNVDNYTVNGFGCYVYGGILGAVIGPYSATVKHNVSDCSMNGNFTTDLYRSAGIVGAELSSCMIANCFNNATCTINTSSRGLFGGITSVMGSYTDISGCMNKGALTCTNSCRVGGIVCLVTANGRTIYGCSNYGIILSDSASRGVFYGYKQSNSVTTHYENCTAAGKLGTYNGGSPVYDSYSTANQVKYLGSQSGTDVLDLKNITYRIGTLEPADPEASLKVLFLGNSFTQDAVYHVPGLVNAAGLTKIKMVHMYYGGRTLIAYNSGWSTSNDYHKYVCSAGSTSWVDNTGANLEKVVSSEEWDVITIQEHTGTYYSWLPGRLEQEKTAIEELCGKIRAAQKGSPKIYFIMSQAYYDFSKSSQIGTYGQFFDPYDHVGMFKAIAEQGQNFKSLTCLTDIISTGAALENLRTSSLAKNHKLCLSRDGYHMDYGVSRYAAACLVYNVALYPLTKISLENNTFRFSNSSTTTGSYSTPVTDSNYKICQKAAELAQSKPFEISDMSAY